MNLLKKNVFILSEFVNGALHSFILFALELLAKSNKVL